MRWFVTLFTARLIGVLTDRKGKVFMFRLMAVLVIFPMVANTLTEGWPMWAVLIGFNCIFCMHERAYDSWHGHHHVGG